MDLTVIATASIIGASFAIAFGTALTNLGEGMVAKQAVASIAQQPDEANQIRSTAFVTIAMIESCSIYSLLVSMILLFANPFWNYAIAQAAKAAA